MCNNDGSGCKGDAPCVVNTDMQAQSWEGPQGCLVLRGNAGRGLFQYNQNFQGAAVADHGPVCLVGVHVAHVSIVRVQQDTSRRTGSVKCGVGGYGRTETTCEGCRDTGGCPAGGFLDSTKCSSFGDDCCAPGVEAATCRGGFFPIRKTGVGCAGHSEGAYMCCSEPGAPPGCPAGSPGPGCCLSQDQNWCAENYAHDTICVNNACGDNDCCVPSVDSQSGSHQGGVCHSKADCLLLPDCVGQMVECFQGVCYRGNQDAACNSVANGGTYGGQQHGHWCWDGRSDTTCATAFTSAAGRCNSEARIP